MGILTYQKIREDSINDNSFDKFCDELLELDKLIYEKIWKLMKWKWQKVM